MIKKILSISLVLLIAGTVGYVYYYQPSSNQPSSNQPSSNQPSSSQTISNQSSSNEPSSRITETLLMSYDSEGNSNGDINMTRRFDLTFEELEKNSAVIVIGESLGENKKSSILHEPVEGSLTKVYDVTKGFDFKVDEWIKGSGPKVINLEVPEATIDLDHPDFKAYWPDEEPQKGKKYIVFLSQSPDKKTHIPPSEVYLFEIDKKSKMLIPKVKNEQDSAEFKIKKFKGEKLEGLIKYLKKLDKERK